MKGCNMEEKSKKLYNAGTLSYTMPKLLLVCCVIILSTLTLNLMAYKMIPALLPILLDENGASAKTIALIISTIPSAVNFFVVPFLSTLSDKTRTKYGRRIPFLAISMPLVIICLLLIAFEKDIAILLHGSVLSAFRFEVASLGVLITVILLYQLVYLVPGSILCYTYVDVVPKQFIGTFMGVTSFSGTCVTFLFNYFVVGHAVENPKLYFSLLAILYGIVFTILCLVVKEGKYPPLKPDSEKQKRNFLQKTADNVKLYFKECYSHRIYVMLFISMGITQASCVCRTMFNLLFATKELGMTATEYGKVMAYGAIVSAVFILPMGKIMDKIHPLRVFFYTGLLVIAVNVWGYFYVVDSRSFMVVGIVVILSYAIQFLANTPMLMKLVPNIKYGQFASANSMINCIILLFASFLGGVATDAFGYRMIFVWDFALTIVATLTLLVVLHDWKKLGGQKNYVPPSID